MHLPPFRLYSIEFDGMRTLRGNTNVSIKTAPKDYVIWPIAVFINYARTCQNPEEQPWADLMGLSAVVFVVFLPCRPVSAQENGLWKAQNRVSDTKCAGGSALA
jgi:hypothetical protein